MSLPPEAIPLPDSPTLGPFESKFFTIISPPPYTSYYNTCALPSLPPPPPIPPKSPLRLLLAAEAARNKPLPPLPEEQDGSKLSTVRTTVRHGSINTTKNRPPRHRRVPTPHFPTYPRHSSSFRIRRKPLPRTSKVGQLPPPLQQRQHRRVGHGRPESLAVSQCGSYYDCKEKSPKREKENIAKAGCNDVEKMESLMGDDKMEMRTTYVIRRKPVPASSLARIELPIRVLEKDEGNKEEERPAEEVEGGNMRLDGEGGSECSWTAGDDDGFFGMILHPASEKRAMDTYRAETASKGEEFLKGLFGFRKRKVSQG